MEITDDLTKLMADAAATGRHYHADFEEYLEGKYGKQWVKDHGEAVSLLCLAASFDYLAAMLYKGMHDIGQKLDKFSDMLPLDES